MSEFPQNVLGLKRGTVLEAIHPIVRQLGLKIGDQIFIGFDGTYVCSGAFDWSIGQLINEIERGIWKICGSIDLSNPLKKELFAIFIEKSREK